MNPIHQTLDFSVNRYFGVHFNKQVWKLLDKTSITVDEGFQLIDLAHASNHHWRLSGTVINQQRGAYLIARTYLAVGNSGAALIYAKRCWNITQNNPPDIKDFDYAYAEEIMWKCELAAGNIEKAAEHKQKARSLGDAIKEPKDKALFDQDFETVYKNLMQKS